MAELTGPAAVVDGVMRAAAAELREGGGEAAQIGLGLDDDDAHAVLVEPAEVLRISLEEGKTLQQATALARARRGRPKGAKNRRTADLAAYLRQFGPDPAVTLMRIQGMPVEILAAQLGCDKETALGHQRAAAAELMPYLHGKKPVDVNVTNEAKMTLVLAGLGGSDGVVIDHQDGPRLLIPEMAENSESSEGGA